ncbi:MAG TPA: hypothetical protein VF596_06835 [Pyrinomonadaceae bacterium]|jgi:hypothetical protein
MNTEFKNIVLMKYGVHAGQTVEEIIKRKRKEYIDCGKLFWGYGGSVCHPTTQIQPFLHEAISRGETVYLLMSRTKSALNNIPKVAAHFSDDAILWEDIPPQISVYGSKYAVVCDELKDCNFQLNLSDYSVAVGKQKGKNLADYLKGRVDKACGTINLKKSNHQETNFLEITLIAKIIKPFAVFVK